MITWKSALLYLGVISGTLCAAILSASTMDAALACLALAALASPLRAYQSLSLAVILKYLNPELATIGPTSGILFWVVMAAGSIRLLLCIQTKNLEIVAPIWLFGLIAFLLSCVTSPALPVSLLKIATLLMVTSGVVCGFQNLPLVDLQRMRLWLFALAVAVIGGSVATLTRPDVAYALVAVNFQGILNHPQALGTFLAPFAAWALAGVLLNQRNRPLEWIFLACIWAVMFMTLARTATISALAGTGLVFVHRLNAGRRTTTQAGVGKAIGLAFAGVAAVVIAVVAIEAVRTSVASFVLKREAETIDQAFYSSRGHGIQSQWTNFLEKPLTGWGYGVYADGTFPDGIVEVAGIPISAPVEKGFIPTAVLEETGIPGAVLFWFFVFRLGSYAFRSTDLRWIAAFVAAVTVNVGEAVLLSPGGIGLHVWIVISFAAAAYRFDESAHAAPTLHAPISPTMHSYPNLLR